MDILNCEADKLQQLKTVLVSTPGHEQESEAELKFGKMSSGMMNLDVFWHVDGRHIN